MNEQTLTNVTRAVCGVLIALPGTLALVPDLVLTPGQNALFLVLALVGATVLSQLQPAGNPKPGDGETAVDALIPQIEALPPAARRELVGRLDMRRVQRESRP